MRTGIMEENGITIRRLLNHFLVSIDNVGVGRLDVIAIIEQYGYVFLIEPMYVHDVLLHVKNIVPLIE